VHAARPTVHFIGRQEYVPPRTARSIDLLHQSVSTRSSMEGRRSRPARNAANWYSKPCNSRGTASSVWEAPMREANTTVDVTQRYNADIAILCASTLTQLVGFGSEDAALIRDMTQPPMKKVSASTTGSVRVCRSAASEAAVSSYICRISLLKSTSRFIARLHPASASSAIMAHVASY
jgi:hypothetical protein